MLTLGGRRDRPMARPCGQGHADTAKRPASVRDAGRGIRAGYSKEAGRSAAGHADGAGGCCCTFRPGKAYQPCGTGAGRGVACGGSFLCVAGASRPGPLRVLGSGLIISMRFKKE